MGVEVRLFLGWVSSWWEWMLFTQLSGITILPLQAAVFSSHVCHTCVDPCLTPPSLNRQERRFWVMRKGVPPGRLQRVPWSFTSNEDI